MDHLTTSEERKARWYCRTIWPRFLRVRTPQYREDLMTDYSRNPTFVYGVPMRWLHEPNKDHDDDSNMISNDFMKKCFRQHGFMVISGVLNQQDCRHSLSLAAEWHRAATAADADHEEFTAAAVAAGKSSTRRINKIPNAAAQQKEHSVRSVEGGILPFYGSGHSAFVWSTRAHPHVHRVFAALLGGSKNDDQLLASLDGIILWDPTNLPTDDIGWFHVDQNPLEKPSATAIQGLVNLIDVDESTGGNVLVLDSHRLFPEHYTSGQNEFYTKRLVELNGDDWLEIDPFDEHLLCPNNVVSICLKAGDMLLWDSRMVHCSYPPSSSATNKQQQEQQQQPQEQQQQQEQQQVKKPTAGPLFLRAATLVSMMPRREISTATCEARRQAVAYARTLTHWVDKAATLGAERSDDTVREQETVAYIKRAYPGVLLGWDDLSPAQKNLVSGRT
jgi:Phytanoyl-CoA dioxygenase (PhyH)